MSILEDLKATDETEAQARVRLHLRPLFKVGQVWLDRSGKTGRFYEWTIVAISNHPVCPVIAQAECGSVREFDLDGMFGGADEGEECDLDLVKLIKDAP